MKVEFTAVNYRYCKSVHLCVVSLFSLSQWHLNKVNISTFLATTSVGTMSDFWLETFSSLWRKWVKKIHCFRSRQLNFYLLIRIDSSVLYIRNNFGVRSYRVSLVLFSQEISSTVCGIDLIIKRLIFGSTKGGDSF